MLTTSIVNEHLEGFFENKKEKRKKQEEEKLTHRVRIVTYPLRLVV